MKKISKMSKKDLKKFQKILGIAILVLLVFALGIYFFVNPKEEQSGGRRRREETPEPQLTIVDLNSTSRPFAVTINNHPVARANHAGLQDAYIIYEVIVEGGMTRLLALFRDINTDRIGSVRSARPYFLDYALENDAFYVYHGQSTQAGNDISALRLDRIVVADSNTGFRDRSLNVATEHTLFTSMDRLRNGIGQQRAEINQRLLLNYSVAEIFLNEMEGAVVANRVEVKYPTLTAEFDFDEETRVYKRSVSGTPHTDAITKQQYTFKNIITYQVENRNSNFVSYGGYQELRNIGSGTGFFITNGYAVPITWSKASREARTIYKHLDGTEIIVNDGNTFIQIQPLNQAINFR